MNTPTLDITVNELADFSVRLTLKDEANAAIDLTGATFRSQIRKNPGNALAVEIGVAVAGSPTNGQLDLHLPYDKTLNLTEPTYKWDLLMIRADGVRVRLLQGAVNFSRSITRV